MSWPIVSWYIRPGKKNAKFTLRRIIESGPHRSDDFYATLNTDQNRSIEKALAVIAQSEYPLSLSFVTFLSNGAAQTLNAYEDLEATKEQARAQAAQRQAEYDARQAEWEAKRLADAELGKLAAIQYESQIDQQVEFLDLVLVSIKVSDPDARFFTVKYTAKRADGLLVWFSTTASAFGSLEVGDTITIRAKVTGVKENFVFCKRPKLLVGIKSNNIQPEV